MIFKATLLQRESPHAAIAAEVETCSSQHLSRLVPFLLLKSRGFPAAKDRGKCKQVWGILLSLLSFHWKFVAGGNQKQPNP